MDVGRLLRAIEFAADRHRHQKRKDVEQTPYIIHPISVATLLAVEGGVEDEALLLAAVLHDTVEDTRTSIEELQESFGPEVARLVTEVTDDKSLPKLERKRLQVEHAPNASAQAMQLKIADKICNLRDFTTDSPVGWSIQRKLEYVEWAREVVGGCRGVNPHMDAIFDQAVVRARHSIGVQ